MKLLVPIFLILFTGHLSVAGSNIKGPNYEDMQKSLKTLVSTHEQSADYVIYGQSINQKPLSLIKIFNKKIILQTPRPAILITGAHHGWEYLNIADRLPKYLLSTRDKLIREFISNGGIAYIVPIVNPDGYTVWRRYNANEFDLNRDYPLPLIGHKGLSQPEIKSFLNYLLADIKKEKAQIKLNLNYHCCGPKSDGMLLYPWAHKEMNSVDLGLFTRISQEVLKIFDNNEIQTGQWARKLYLGSGTATDYFYSVHSALAFNFEGSWGKENLRFKQHQDMIKLLIKMIQ